MAIERDTDDAVTPAPAAGRRYNHKQRPYIDALACCPMKYRATLAGTEDGKRVEVSGEVCRSEAEATASAWEALRVWALAGRVPV
jgi:hypothetical protein